MAGTRMAVSLGASAGNPILEAFEGYAAKDAILITRRCLNEAEVKEQTLQACGGEVLFLLPTADPSAALVHESLRVLQEHWQQLDPRPKVSTLLALQGEFSCTGALVHRWLSEGWVDVFLGPLPANATHAAAQVEGLKHRIEQGLRKTHRRLGVQHGGAAFVSTPFALPNPDPNSETHKEGRLHSDSAFLSAFLAQMGFVADLESEVANGKDVPRKAVGHIKDCAIFLANVGECDERRSRCNPNVYIEIGAALAHERPIILFRPADERGRPLPIMGGVPEVLYYDSQPDLAWQVYHKLVGEPKA